MKKSLCFLLFALCLTVAANAQSLCETPTNVTVNPGTTTATVSWTGNQEEYNVRYNHVIYHSGFDTDESFDDWSTYDQDGDGETWSIAYGYGKSSSTCLFSASYGRTPDNWLLSPTIDLGGTMSVWISSYTSFYPENFAIYVAIGEAAESLSFDDFVKVTEDITAPEEYTEYTVDLSAYAGQQGLIAIRHYNSDNNYYLFVDDFSVYNQETFMGETHIGNSANLTGLDIETTYGVQVQGICEGGVSEWSKCIVFTTHGLCDAPSNLTAIPGATTATVGWDGYQEEYNVRRFVNMIYHSDFETDESTTGWYLIDNDGDGNGWNTLEDSRYSHSGVYSVYSISDEYTPDNWLLSPTIDLGGAMSVWIRSYSSSYLENFAIYVALGEAGSVSVGDFVKITEDITAPEEYTEYTVDLSAYAGQQGCIAIRHYNSDDMAYLFVDDFSVCETIVEAHVSNPVDHFTDLQPETTYGIEVQGVCGDGVTEWSDLFEFTTHGLCDTPSDLNATPGANTATLEWTGYQEQYNVRYITERTVVFSEDFESGMPSDWITIDADGDGEEWYFKGGMDEEFYHSGTGLVTSASYINYVGALTPDNWLISPQIELGGSISVWLNGQDVKDNKEHFAIYLSTTGTEVTDFTVTLVPETETTHEWKEYTADLSAYAGQQGYIAIRHFNCTNMFRLNVDDFRVFGENDWTTVTTTGNSVNLTGLTPETTYEVQVQGFCPDGVTKWSEVIKFTTTERPEEPIVSGECGIATDCDGHNYPTVNLGNVCWMTKNLAVESCVTSGNVYSYVNDQFPDESANVAAYGKLYDLAAAMQGIGAKTSTSLQSICPTGWQLPTTEQIEELKATYTAEELRNSTGWLVNSGTNGTGFSWDGSGFRNGTSNYFEHLLMEGYLWAVDMTSGTPQPALYKMMCGCNEIFRVYDFDGISASIRCVKAPFKCGVDKMKDGNDIEYETVEIDVTLPGATIPTKQCWTKTNLRSTKKADGTDIGNGISETPDVAIPYYYDYSTSGIPLEERGYLYNWPAAMTLCPTGWHLPTDADWTTLEQKFSTVTIDPTATGYRGDHAGKLSGSTYWESSSNDNAPGNTTYSGWGNSGFSAVPAGFYSGWTFDFVRYNAYFWSSTQSTSDPSYAYDRDLYKGNAGVKRNSINKLSGFSVRCLRDSE